VQEENADAVVEEELANLEDADAAISSAVIEETADDTETAAAAMTSQAEDDSSSSSAAPTSVPAAPIPSPTPSPAAVFMSPPKQLYAIDITNLDSKETLQVVMKYEDAVSLLSVIRLVSARHNIEVLSFVFIYFFI
jgi:cell division septation protein DedD